MQEQILKKMLQHNSETYSCFNMGTSELLINDVMLKVEPQSAEVHLTRLTAQHQRGQSVIHMW